MDPDLMRVAGAVLGLVIGSPLAVASVKLVLFVGKATATMEATAATMRDLQQTQGQHGERLADVEARVEMIERQPASGRPFPPFRPEPSR